MDAEAEHLLRRLLARVVELEFQLYALDPEPEIVPKELPMLTAMELPAAILDRLVRI
jgi:hypothetical protein